MKVEDLVKDFAVYFLLDLDVFRGYMYHLEIELLIDIGVSLLAGNGAIFLHSLIDADHQILEKTGSQVEDIEILRIQSSLFLLFLEDTIKYLQF